MVKGPITKSHVCSETLACECMHGLKPITACTESSNSTSFKLNIIVNNRQIEVLDIHPSGFLWKKFCEDGDDTISPAWAKEWWARCSPFGRTNTASTRLRRQTHFGCKFHDQKPPSSCCQTSSPHLALLQDLQPSCWSRAFEAHRRKQTSLS